MQPHALPVGPEAHSLPGRQQAASRPGGQPGDPALTHALAELIEATRERAGVSRGAMLAAVGASLQCWRSWRSGRHRVRQGKAQRIFERVRLVQAIDLDAIRATAPGQRTARFLDAVNDARQRQERG